MHNTALLLCNYRIIADKCTSAMDYLYENFNKLLKSTSTNIAPIRSIPLWYFGMNY